MRKLKAVKPSPALAVALVALFVALGGSAYAALIITGKNVKNGSLTTKDVKNKSLLAGDFKAGQLPAGPAGKNGATNVVVRSASFTTSGSVTCNSGETATGGGVEGLDSVDVIVMTSRPEPASGVPKGWFAQLRAAGEPGIVYVLCASP